MILLANLVGLGLLQYPIKLGLVVVVVVGASEHQSGDMMKFVFQIDLSVIAALNSSLLSPVSLFKTSKYLVLYSITMNNLASFYHQKF